MQFFKFDEFTLDLTKRKLFCRKTEIELRDKDFDVLLFLIKNRHETQSKDKIIEYVWDGMAVEENSVERAIVNIRKSLGDNASKPLFIKTFRGRGYLFICNVEEIDEESQSNWVENSPKISWRLYSMIPALVLVLCMGLIWWNVFGIWNYFTTKTVFSDDFQGTKINSEKWRFEGSSVRVNDGISRISVDKFKNGGKLVSDYFVYDPTKPLTIKSRMRVSFNQTIKKPVKFIGAFGFIGENETVNKNFVGLKYINTEVEFHDEGKVHTEGFYLVKDDANMLDDMNYCNGKIGPRADTLWGEWFEQEMTYEPNTETIKYFINNKKQGEFFVGALPSNKENKLRLSIHPQGIFLHHAIEIDYIEISQCVLPNFFVCIKRNNSTILHPRQKTL